MPRTRPAAPAPIGWGHPVSLGTWCLWVSAAIYLVEYTKRDPGLRNSSAAETLSGIPSIVYGLLVTAVLRSPAEIEYSCWLALHAFPDDPAPYHATTEEALGARHPGQLGWAPDGCAPSSGWCSPALAGILAGDPWDRPYRRRNGLDLHGRYGTQDP